MRETVYRIPAPVKKRIALVTDLHNRPYKKVIRSLRRRRPDLIAVAGDLMEGYKDKKGLLFANSNAYVLPFLRACVSIAPTYVSLGNHEQIVCEEDLKLLRATGAVVLDNGWVEADGLLIGGLTSAFVTEYRAYRERMSKETGHWIRYPYQAGSGRMPGRHPRAVWLQDFEKQEGYKLLICHHPEYWSLREPYLKYRKFDLVFSGHAHGGQIRLFGKSLFAPGQGWMPAFTGGVHKGLHGRLVISRGLTNTALFIPRLGNPTEIVYVLLAPNIKE